MSFAIYLAALLVGIVGGIVIFGMNWYTVLPVAGVGIVGYLCGGLAGFDRGWKAAQGIGGAKKK